LVKDSGIAGKDVVAVWGVLMNHHKTQSVAGVAEVPR
jgi:hypothetical protein